MILFLKSIFIAATLVIASSCRSTYVAKPLSFKTPAAYANVQTIGDTLVAAKAYPESKEAAEAFGFNIRSAGMLPVQVVFDNQGSHRFEIDPTQTFLEDDEGNLWPILAKNLAYERATKYIQTKEIFKGAGYHSFLGAAAGALVGGAIGVVTGENVGSAAGKGAVAGAATGAVLGGAGGYQSTKARRAVTEDLKGKSLDAKSIGPKSLSYGYIFFPGEAKSAKQLRLNLLQTDTNQSHLVILAF